MNLNIFSKKPTAVLQTEMKVVLTHLANPSRELLTELPAVNDAVCPNPTWAPRAQTVLFCMVRHLPLSLRGTPFMLYTVTECGTARIRMHADWAGRKNFDVALVPDAQNAELRYKRIGRDRSLVSLRSARTGAPWLLDDEALADWQFLRQPISAKHFKAFVKGFVQDLIALPKRGVRAGYDCLVNDDASWLK